jgi:Tol biopolymer transport system component
MTLATGSRLGPYEVVAPLGAGGMGEVYRARDSRLGRDVALKVLPERLANDPDALARFEREARAVAALSHPHIVALFDIGREGPTAFLIMELLAGESLAERLARGALPLREALGLATQVAAALAAAHRQGVVHRDLKPANVMLTRSGVKLLDFGLAKWRGATSTVSEGWTQLPTAAGEGQTPLTAEGSLLGTLQYMAPEQLEGREADARSDLFAFGALLYEMVSGRRAFQGATPASVIAAILKEEPLPLGEVQPLAPPALEWLVRRCLAKDPEDRWQSAADLAADLGRVAGAAASDTGPRAATAPRARAARWSSPWLAWCLAAALGIASAVAATLLWRERAAAGPAHVALAPPRGVGAISWVEVAPDGRSVAFVGTDAASRATALWVQLFAEEGARRLPGTDHATQPFWSPDGRFVGFFADGKLLKVALAGGPPIPLAETASPFGGSWGSRGTIVFAPNQLDGIFAVSENGGPARRVTRLGPHEEAHRWPCFLPGGERFVLLADSSLTEYHQIRSGSIHGGDAPALLHAISNVRYAAGRLLYVRGGSLLAQPFDGRDGLGAEAVAIAEDLAEVGDAHFFEFSAGAAVLAYRSAAPGARFVWLDRQGAVVEQAAEPDRYGEFALSRDRSRLAYEHLNSDGRREAVWWLDLSRGIASVAVRADAEGNPGNPVWSPDGRQIAYARFSSEAPRLMGVRVDRPAAPRLLVPSAGKLGDIPWDWSPDGHLVLFDRASANKQALWVLSLADGRARPWADVPYGMGRATLSPDGRWLAYVANPSGRAEVYVEPFPEGGAPSQVSIGGGDFPSWRADGTEIYFVGKEQRLMAVRLGRSEGGALPSPPEVLFEVDRLDHPLSTAAGVTVSADGQRFLMKEKLENAELAPVRVVFGWKPP